MVIKFLKISMWVYNLKVILSEGSTSKSKSEYTVDNNIEFINNIKLEKVPTSHSFISFDMKSLFTNFLLHWYSQHNTQDRRVYDAWEYTVISKKEMKELLLLCTKKKHFTCNNELYQQCDGVAIWKKPLIPNLIEHMSPWKWYIDGSYKIIIIWTCIINFQQLSPKHWMYIWAGAKW